MEDSSWCRAYLVKIPSESNTFFNKRVLLNIRQLNETDVVLCSEDVGRHETTFWLCKRSLNMKKCHYVHETYDMIFSCHFMKIFHN